MSNVSSILDHRIAMAYGLRTRPLARPAAVDRISPAASERRESTPANIARLVGAVVPGRVSFDEITGAAVPSNGPIPMYRSPADRNAAAVAVELGRTIDVRG